MKKIKRVPLYCVPLFLLIALTAISAGAADSENNWWDVEPEEENPSPYYDSILYSEIPPMLHRLEEDSDRINVKVIGHSAGGRNLFLAIIAADGENQGRFGYYKQIRKLMRNDPEAAIDLLETKNVKVPVFINGSIHGNEYPGTDTCMRLVRRFAYYNGEEIRSILDNVVLLINVCQNPDGRVLGQRRNAADFDVNRDLFNLTQPESQTTVKVVREWNPMVFLDLHGFVNPMLIEPCTPPHQPNMEYDLFLKWALPQAYAMEDELKFQTGYDAIIPYRDWPQAYAWDDWSPSYAGVYSILPGAYGHTLETPYRDERGVDAQYAAIWGALKFIVENKNDMLRDQIEIYKRGFNAEPQQPIPEELLAETEYEQYEDLTVQTFPAAYVIPAEAPLQKNPHAAADVIDFLIMHGIEVKKAKETFAAGDTVYPEGTYVVEMNQPKRSLANTILEDGADLSDVEGGLEFYSPPVSWSTPLLWGATRIIIDEPLDVETKKVYKAVRNDGNISAETESGALAWRPSNLEAYQAAVALLNGGTQVYRATEAFAEGDLDFGAGTFIVSSTIAREAKDTLTKTYRQDIFGLAEVPEESVMLNTRKIVITDDPYMSFCLENLGFDYENLSSIHIDEDADLSQYDLFINTNLEWDNLEDEEISVMQDFFNGGGDYIGIYYRGVTFAMDAGIADVEFAENLDGDGIVSIAYDTATSAGAGFASDSHAFIADPLWFTRLGDNVTSVAKIGRGDFFKSGYWPGWETEGAAGMPVIVHAETGNQDTILMGIEPLFRGYPKDTFRAVANAIFSGLE